MRENVYIKTWRWRIAQRYVSALMLLTPVACMASTSATLAAIGHGQLTALTAGNSMYTVKSVLSYIEKNSNYVFVYNAEVQKMMPNRVRVNLDGRPALQILDEMCAATGLAYKAQGNQISLAQAKNAQSGQPDKGQKRRIKGNVSDAKGEPIVGATISEKGGTGGTITDINGDFTLELTPGNLVTVSYVGFKPQTVKPTEGMHVTLDEQTRGLDEVVVIGYGTKKKANLIGAVSTVGAEELKDRPVGSVGQMLQGQVPNLNITFASGTPGETTTLNIRGATSIANTGAPLVLIDGVESSIDRVNPKDIESISVLKDAASAAIYGARAGFGVVLITTKNNKDGQAHISYNGRFSFSAPTTKTDFMTVGYDVARLVDAFQMADNGSTYTSFEKSDYDELKARRYDTVENPARPWTVVGPDGRYRYYGNFNWYDYIYDFKQPTWNHNLSVSGGTEKINYLVSANLSNKTGIFAINPDKYSTKTLMSKVSAQVKPWFKLTGTTSLFRSEYKAFGYDYEDGGNFDNLSQHAMPWVLPYNPDGTNVYNYAPSKHRPTNGFHAMLREGNGFAEVKKTQSTYALNGVLTPMAGLSIVGNVSYRLFYREKTTRQAPMTYSERPGVLEQANTIFFQNRLKEIRTTEEYWVYDLYASYQKTFADVHNFNAIVGLNHETGRYKNVEGNVTNLPSIYLNDLKLGTGIRGVKGGQYEYALLGYFGRLSYDYAGKYLVEFNIRHDGTSRFPANHRWGTFPSIALGWRLSDEAFFKSLKTVANNVKLRFSVGSLGNQVTDSYANPYYPYIRSASIKQSNIINRIADNKYFYYIELDPPVSADLTWETVVTKNLGFDLGFFNNRLTAVLDLYQRDTKDMLATSLTLPDVYGYAAPKENNGHLRTKGFELTIGWSDRFNLGGKPFSYSVSASLADSKSKLIKFKGNETKVLGSAYEGMEWGEIWGYRIEGIYQTDQQAIDRGVDQSFISSRFTSNAGDLIFADIDDSKKIDNGKGTLDDHGDLVKLGNSLPRYHYGLSASASWNGIDLSFFLQGIGRQHLYPHENNFAFWGPFSRPYMSFIPTNLPSQLWSAENPNAYFPRPAAGIARNNMVLTKVNDRYLQNLAYCRLKNITLGYTLPASLTQKMMISSVRIYFSGENLFTISKLDSKYLDPEQISGKGASGNVYPYSKTFAFGLDITF